MEKTIRARITGRVQGVGFRAWAQGEALRLGLSGWVRNADDGSVEALVSGPDAAVDDMLAALERGPRLARVDAVAAAPSDLPAPEGFVIRR